MINHNDSAVPEMDINEDSHMLCGVAGLPMEAPRVEAVLQTTLGTVDSGRTMKLSDGDVEEEMETALSSLPITRFGYG